METKSPAVLFYTSDFLTGVSNLTMEERGQYITLLCLQHQIGHLSKKAISINVGNVSNDVITKFIKDEKGLYYNERMEEETIKRNGYVESRYNNGYKGGRPKGTTKKAIKEKNDWEIMLNFFDNKCIKCGYQFEKPNKPTKDHIIPKSWGGIDDISNYQPLCRKCNASKCADYKEDYRLNYIDKIPKKLKTIWFPYGYDLKNHIGNDNDNDNINVYYNNKELNNIFIEYLKLRKKLKAVNSDTAIKLLINKLNQYDDDIKIKMIENSIQNSWKSVYELKENEKTKLIEPKWFNENIETKECSEEDKKELEELLKDFK